jgi:hypothetical protein
MAGGLMQLVAYGAQDVYLTGSPKVTFFQAVYKRHTNFAMETIEQVVNGSPGDSARLSVTVARNGDLIGEMYLEMTTGSGLVTTSTDLVASTEWIAERAVADVELTIGGQRIDKHYQKWWRLYSELYLDEAKRIQYGKMTSASSTGGDKVYLPLIFFFNRNPGLYLPLIALQYHEVRLDVTLTSVFETYMATSGFKVWGNYVYLDTEERRRFAQKGHEYLIEQVQHTGVDTVSVDNPTSAKQVRLSYNHPVKELVWCFSEHGTAATYNDMWDTTSAVGNVQVSTLPTSVDTYLSPNVCGAPMIFQDNTSSTSDMWVEEGAAPTTQGVSVGPLATFKLILNGQDRFKEQSGKYFNQVQPFYHHSGNPYPGIYSYSFALKPEEHQPTGTCNFSRIDNAQVAVAQKANTKRTTNMHMFAVNYNVLRIQSGMGGLAFSN